MKTFILVTAVVVLSVFNLTGVLSTRISADEEANMRCDSLTGCGSTAHCDGRGTANLCNISCEDGAFIQCGNKPLND